MTRAQFAAFQTDCPVPTGQENYPASHITFEQAQAYCRWLNQRTGRTWRLPTEKERDQLETSAREPDDVPGIENTLDYWAGVAPNPEDAVRLREKASALGTQGLLREVGSFSGLGDDPLFDLDGNAAEWVTHANSSTWQNSWRWR